MFFECKVIIPWFFVVCENSVELFVFRRVVSYFSVCSGIIMTLISDYYPLRWLRLASVFFWWDGVDTVVPV